MRKEEYIKTLIVNNKEIKLGIDDYGQCYFIEFINDNGDIEELSLGTYNCDYMEEIYGLFDEEYKKLLEKEFLKKPFSKSDKNKMDKYKKLFKEEYRNC